MTLRIIGGAFRNRILKSPKSTQTRPTLAIMRKAVFDILQAQIENAHFLDLYAGTGAMGLEALSRGAAQAVFVETNRHALHCIEENIKNLDVESQCTVLGYDCLLALKKLGKGKRRFDVVYVDPPYEESVLEEILMFFDTHTLLNAGGVLFLEEGVPAVLKSFKLSQLYHVDSRSFSRSTLHQFRVPS